MGYVAIKGGRAAIQEAAKLLEFLRAEGSAAPLPAGDIQHQLRLLHSRVLSEGSLYHPELCSLAIKQSMGDSLEAAFMLRAYRSTRARLQETPLHDTTRMRLIRRISAAFKNVPGGQMLGPTSDYSQRLFRFELMDESPESFRRIVQEWMAEAIAATEIPDNFPKVLDVLRAEGLLPQIQDCGVPFDVTRAPIVFPVPRSAALYMMSRGETGSLLGLAYSNMRGYGDIHPTVAELRVGYLPVMLPSPATGELVEAGEVLMTECEIVSMYEKGDEEKPTFGLGYGACFGHNEVKAIAMAVLDRALQKGARDGPKNPSEDAEFVLLHIDGIESMGFATHYKMPHYVTFQSDLDRLRKARQQAREEV
jgi:alpha-D-ribose 1-methylphosphonate 5-triphosphate synthase subunit PhnI